MLAALLYGAGNCANAGLVGAKTVRLADGFESAPAKPVFNTAATKEEKLGLATAISTMFLCPRDCASLIP